MIKIQIVVEHKLIGAVIVESLREADKLWSRWAILRYRRNEPIGCAAFLNPDDGWNLTKGNEGEDDNV